MMMTNTFAKIAAATAICGIIAIGFALRVTGQQQRPTEFTLVEAVVATNLTSGKSTSLTKKFARRADGESVTQNIDGAAGINHDKLVTVTKIYTPSSSTEVLHDSVTNMKFTMRGVSQPHTGKSSTECKPPQDGAAFIGEGVIAGQTVKRYHFEDASSIQDASLAPALDCMILDRSIQWKSKTGAINGTTTHRIVSFTIGPPDQKLFIIPADAPEARPSDIFRAQRSALHPGEACPECLERMGTRTDDQYFKGQTTP